MFELFAKLEKLKIHAYDSAERSGKLVGTFEAMFNPATLQQRYEINYAAPQAINSTGKSARYSHSKPAMLNLKLILDGTGVVTDGGPSLLSLFAKPKSVSERVSDFLLLAYHMNGEIHEPNYLAVEWGDLGFWGSKRFNCRLANVDIAYTTFDRNGSALRAELDVSLFSDEEVEKRVKQEDKRSPDLTHSRIVRMGDTLPLLCKEIYGQSHYYLRVAQVNQLDNFRELTPGQQLLFPPLAGE